MTGISAVFKAIFLIRTSIQLVVTYQHRILGCILLVIYVLQQTDCLMYSGPFYEYVPQLVQTADASIQKQHLAHKPHTSRFLSSHFLPLFILTIFNRHYIFETSVYYSVHVYHALNHSFMSHYKIPFKPCLMLSTQSCNVNTPTA